MEPNHGNQRSGVFAAARVTGSGRRFTAADWAEAALDAEKVLAEQEAAQPMAAE